jgi:PBP1b-binding outer membrane lipoprotein LpoB
MSFRTLPPAIALGLLVAGCSSQQTLQSVEPQATRLAQKQGETDLQCPTAASSVVSSVLKEPGTDPLATQRLEYKVAVAGCGKSNTYSVLCIQDGSGCYVLAPGASR